MAKQLLLDHLQNIVQTSISIYIYTSHHVQYVTYNWGFYFYIVFQVPYSTTVTPTVAPMVPGGPLPFEGSNPFALEGLRQTASWQDKIRYIIRWTSIEG